MSGYLVGERLVFRRWEPVDIKGYLALREIRRRELTELVWAGILEEKEYVAESSLRIWDFEVGWIPTVEGLVGLTDDIEDADGAGDQGFIPAFVLVAQDALFDVLESVDEVEIAKSFG